MELPVLWPVLLLGLSGALAQTNLDEKVFVFPKSSTNSYIQLKPHLSEPLRQFTVCLSFYSDLSRELALLSCASRNTANEILLLKYSPTVYHVYVGGNYHAYTVSGSTDRGNHWENVCVAWNSTTGIVQLWIDRMPIPRKGLSKDYAITTDLVMMLGQEQDSYGDLDEKVFVFPKPSSNSYVQLKPHLPEPLRQFTVCLSFYTDLPREFALLSCASRNRDNEILLLKHSPTVYNIYVGGNNHSYIVTGNTDRGYHWENVCVAWSLTTGIVQLFLDGMATPKKRPIKRLRDYNRFSDDVRPRPRFVWRFTCQTAVLRGGNNRRLHVGFCLASTRTEEDLEKDRACPSVELDSSEL
uniref:Uncharacterized protein n=1 Tax=Sphaerodactylus townsendi TaxID=933632 RepID=A0ACB8G8Y1_9SAUR